MSRPWAGQVAVVTGGASGIGRALVRALAAEGARVYAADRDASGAQDAAQAATFDGRATGGRAEGVACDVTRPEDLVDVVARARAAGGRLDLLINNAGVGIVGEVRDIPVAEWRRVLDVVLLGVVHGVAAAYPVMVAQGRGTLVNVASILGLTPGPLHGPYTTAKHAVVGLTKALRVEARDLGVSVTCVCPGYVDTPIHAGSAHHAMRQGDLAGGLRPTTPEVVAAATLRGAARGDALVLVPGHARGIAWLARFAPGLVEALSARRVAAARRDLRAPG